MAMARQKKLDKMDIIELDREKPKPEFHFKTARTSGKMIFETNDLVIGLRRTADKTVKYPHGTRRTHRPDRCKRYR